MKIPGKKRLLLAAGSAATLGAVATLVSGVTFGLFSSQQASGSNSFTGGTVTLSQTAAVTCAVGGGNSAVGSGTDSVTAPSTATSSTLFTGSANYVGWTITDASSKIPSGTTIVAENNTAGTVGGVPAHSVTLSTNGATTQASDQLTVQTTNVQPGDGSAGWAPNPGVANTAAGSDPTCSMPITYGGNAPAFMAVDVLVEAQAAASCAVAYGQTSCTPSKLFDETASGLQLQLTDAINGNPPEYVNGYKYHTSGGVATAIPSVTCPVGAPVGSTCYQVLDLLVSTTPSSSGTNHTDTFNLDYALPSSAGNPYQGATAQIVMTAHAVQSTSNPLPGSCTTATQQCDHATDTMNWS